jgi:hypothetical protein
MLWCDGPTVERNGATILMQHDAETGARRVVVDDECGVEVGRLECRADDQRLLDGVEGMVGSGIPGLTPLSSLGTTRPEQPRPWLGPWLRCRQR